MGALSLFSRAEHQTGYPRRNGGQGYPYDRQQQLSGADFGRARDQSGRGGARKIRQRMFGQQVSERHAGNARRFGKRTRRVFAQGGRRYLFHGISVKSRHHQRSRRAYGHRLVR